MVRAVEWTMTGRRGYSQFVKGTRSRRSSPVAFVVEERRISLQTEANNAVRLLDSGRVLC